MNDDVLNANDKRENNSDDYNLLVVSLDLNLHAWGRRSLEKKRMMQSGSTNRTLITLSPFINQLLVFLNSYLVSDSRNKVAIVASSYQSSDFIFPTVSQESAVENGQKSQSSSSTSSGSAAYTNLMGVDRDTTEFFYNEISFSNMRKALLDYVSSLQNKFMSHHHTTTTTTNGEAYSINNETSGTANTQKLLSTSLSGSLTKSLCYINRLQKEKPQGINLQSRILIFQLCHDIPTQYISVMNAIFSAQKMGVVLDSVVLTSDTDSGFLQQASHITEGVYMKPVRQEGLLQYLMNVFIVNVQLRRGWINLPVQSTVDFRASCFETKQSIDQGFVCSICLSVFSKFIPVCSTCGEKLALPTISQPRPLTTTTGVAAPAPLTSQLIKK